MGAFSEAIRIYGGLTSEREFHLKQAEFYQSLCNQRNGLSATDKVSDRYYLFCVQKLGSHALAALKADAQVIKFEKMVTETHIDDTDLLT